MLRTRELGDADLIVSLLTRHSGQVRGVARSARSSRKRFGGVLEPLTHVQAEWTEKSGRELHRIDALECVRSFAEMQADPGRQAVCAVLVELVEAFSREGEADPGGFRLLGAVLDALERGSDGWVMLRYFEYWTLRLHGLLPGLEACMMCGQAIPPGVAAWVAEGNGIRCAECHELPDGGGPRLGRADRTFLEQARKQAPAEMPARFPGARPGRALEALLRRTLEAFAERRFRTYRHVGAAVRGETQGVDA